MLKTFDSFKDTKNELINFFQMLLDESYLVYSTTAVPQRLLKMGKAVRIRLSVFSYGVIFRLDF